MSLTININDLSLCHKGSNGISTATLPDVCKTPSPGGPVPLPYPNISMSSDLENGTTTVEADGGNMIAIKGSDFSRSSGDEPGTAGGVKSNVNMKESKWILYSFDVKFEDANVCRLTDKKSQNHENTVDATGLVQKNVVVAGIDITKIACDCIKSKPYSIVEDREEEDWLKCLILGSIRHSCVAGKLNALDPQKTGVHAGGGANYDSDALPAGNAYCRPDIVVTAPGVTPPIAATDMIRIYDLKFQCNKDGKLLPAKEWDPRKQLGTAQRKCYEKIKLPGGDAKTGGVKVSSIAPTKENCE